MQHDIPIAVMALLTVLTLSVFVDYGAMQEIVVHIVLSAALLWTAVLVKFMRSYDRFRKSRFGL